jgi:hypothetical protein
MFFSHCLAVEVATGSGCAEIIRPLFRVRNGVLAQNRKKCNPSNMSIFAVLSQVFACLRRFCPILRFFWPSLRFVYPCHYRACIKFFDAVQAMLFDKINARRAVEMTSPVHLLAHRLKAIIFINQLIILAGISRTPAALECWGVAFEERLGLIGPGGGEPGKWRNYLSGVLPQGKLRSALIYEFPALEEVLNNPLWAVLHSLDVSSDHGKTLVMQLRLHDKPLHGLQRPRLQRRITAAYWQDLGYWLVILAGAIEKYRWAREFMRERFFVYLHLICVQPEFTGAAKWLHPLLDYHFGQGHLAPLAGWPLSTEKFENNVRLFRGFPRRLMKWVHIEGELELGFFCADPEGFEVVRFGYGLYWDADWNRRVLTAKEKRYLSPPLQISLEGLPADGNRRRRSASEKRAA